jgi:hypothetical protein
MLAREADGHTIDCCSGQNVFTACDLAILNVTGTDHYLQ